MHRVGRRLAAAAALGFGLIAAAAPADARRYAAIVVDAADGAILHEENPDRRIFPASLTKMMTLYMMFDAIEAGRMRMNTPIRVSKRAAAQPASKIGLRAGARITAEDAINALVTKSANDVATAVAEHLGGSESRFAAAMTKRARTMGLTRTTFKHASGLPNESQLTTVRDMAKLSLALLR
ncbi:MAG: serine hydrolase, partial [Pseudomonadota bacterium]